MARNSKGRKKRDKILTQGLGGKGKVEVSRFKGLGEMNPTQLKETTMDPKNRKLIKIINNKEIGTKETINALMGKTAEKRFEFIQENAKFTNSLDI